MLKAIRPSVATTGTSDTGILPASASPAGTSVSTRQRGLPEALQHLANVRVDVLPIVHERRPGAFVRDLREPTNARLVPRSRRSRSDRRIPAGADLRREHGGHDLRRVHRHVPAGSTVESLDADAQDSRDDVSITALPTFSVTASLSLRKLEEALSRCASPVSGLIRDAQMLYAVASDHTLPDMARQYLQRVGQVIDIVSGFHPTLGLVQGVCGLGARGLEILRGSPATESDLHNVALMMKAATHHRQDRRLPDDDGAFGAVGPGALQQEQARDGTLTLGESGADDSDAPGAAQTFEVNYAQVADAELGAGDESAVIPVDEQEHEQEFDATNDRETLPVDDVATMPKRIDMDSTQTSGASSRGYPQPISSAVIDAVPIVFFEASNHQRARWQRVPLLAYAESVPCPRGGKDGQRFRVNDIDYVQFDGLAYPFYAALPGSEFVYSMSNERLPPLPLEKRGSVRVLKAPKLHAAKKIPIFPGADGFIRVHNKRYVVYGQIVVEAERPQLIGEVQIEQNAMFIDEVVGAPDAVGVIHTRSGTPVIEGGRGYYRIRASVVPDEVELLDARGAPVNVRLKYDKAMRRWSISSNLRDAPLIRQASQDSLNTYQEKLTWSAFLRQRPLLRKAVSLMLDQLDRYNLYRSNRLSPRDSGGRWITDIYQVRKEISRNLRDRSKWDELSVKQRQWMASKATWFFFNEHAYWTSTAGSQAFCSEMLDIAFAVMSQSALDNRHLLQIVFHELPGSGRSHVAMLYADNPTVFEKFGKINLPAGDATLHAVDHQAFADWLLEHRETVAIIDPWGPEKLNDFSLSNSRSDVELRLNVNLREAKFNMDGPVRYRVGALVPSRELKADRRVSVVASKDVSGDQKAPCALLDGCLR